jgi:hypothetical protein
VDLEVLLDDAEGEGQELQQKNVLLHSWLTPPRSLQFALELFNFTDLSSLFPPLLRLSTSNMNLRHATVADLMEMQNCNLHNLPEVCFPVYFHSPVYQTDLFLRTFAELPNEVLCALSLLLPSSQYKH